MENFLEFTLTMDPPPEPAKNLPPGAKAGDRVGMIMLSVVWWTLDGKIANELEYGRLTWDGFNVDEFRPWEGAPGGLKNEWPPRALL